LATTTYNAEIFPAMRVFLDNLVERNFKKRKVAFIENGSWAPVAAKAMQTKLENCKELEFVQPIVKIRSSLNPESSEQLNALAEELSR
jgi:flavorubredoxin